MVNITWQWCTNIEISLKSDVFTMDKQDINVYNKKESKRVAKKRRMKDDQSGIGNAETWGMEG